MPRHCPVPPLAAMPRRRARARLLARPAEAPLARGWGRGRSGCFPKCVPRTRAPWGGSQGGQEGGGGRTEERGIR
eukprot:6598462-Pyramimonas_sp.AAC.1